MGIVDFLLGGRRKTMDVVGNKHIGDPPDRIAMYGFRQGMWVMHKYHVAILMDIRDGIATVDYVGQDGTTLSTGVVQASSIRQAKLSEIPEPRRPNKAIADKMGY